MPLTVDVDSVVVVANVAKRLQWARCRCCWCWCRVARWGRLGLVDDDGGDDDEATAVDSVRDNKRKYILPVWYIKVTLFKWISHCQSSSNLCLPLLFCFSSELDTTTRAVFFFFCSKLKRVEIQAMYVCMLFSFFCISVTRLSLTSSIIQIFLFYCIACCCLLLFDV